MRRTLQRHTYHEYHTKVDEYRGAYLGGKRSFRSIYDSLLVYYRLWWFWVSTLIGHILFSAIRQSRTYVWLSP
jgi:hypothetical protein